MTKTTIITTFLTIAVLNLGSVSAADSPATKATAIGGRQMSTSAPLNVITGLASMPLAFTENQGLWDDQVLFRANAGGATMWFTKDGACYQFTRCIPKDCAWRTSPSATAQEELAHVDLRQPRDLDRGRQMSTSAPLSIDAAHEDIRRAHNLGAPPLAVGSLVGRNPRGFDNSTDSIETIMIKASFIGANPNPRMVGEGLMEYKCNYFLGNDPSKWRTDVPNYSAVVYEGIYPGIDLKYYGNGQQMEYDFIVSPGADPSRIMVQYEGARSVSVNSAGQLVVETDWGEVIEQRPVVYQMSGGDRVSLAGEYVLKGDQAFGFELPHGYNPSLALVIDPVLIYKGYLGGDDCYDSGHGIAVDTNGDVYVTGQLCTGFPTENPFQPEQAGGGDLFVVKMDGSDGSLIYSTYLGGSGGDGGYGIAVDSEGNAYVTGITYSSDFPTVNPCQLDQPNSDAFVTKMNSIGNDLIYSTYLGDSLDDAAYDIHVDGAGNAYVVGYDVWYDSAMQLNNTDVLVAKLNSEGTGLVYKTKIGGSSIDYGFGIAVDLDGNAYIAGETSSSDFPAVNPFQTDQPNIDAFVAKLNSAGSNLLYSTYLGGSNKDYGKDVAVDSGGSAYVTGWTLSSNFPLEKAYDSTLSGAPPVTDFPVGNATDTTLRAAPYSYWDVFVTKLLPTGDALAYSTYLGGSRNDFGYGIAVDGQGCAFVTGDAKGNFPKVNPFDACGGYPLGHDGFVTKFSSDGSELEYSSCVGSYWGNWCEAIAIDAKGYAYVVGTSWGRDYPYSDAHVAFIGCCTLVGNVDGEGGINVADLTYLVDYLFRSGPVPPCLEEGDVDGSGEINVADLTYLVDYLFRGGPPPPPCP